MLVIVFEYLFKKHIIMKTITITHDSLRNGKFPIDKIEEIPGITVSELKGDKSFVYIYSINIDTEIHKDPIQNIACELGMMIQSYIIKQLYLER